MLGHRLITKQTSKDGILVQKIMIAESVDIARETYVCILMDRQHNGPVLIASPAGGMDIEAVAEKHPEQIKTVPLDIYHGIDDKIAKDVCVFLGFSETDILKKAMYELKNLWKLFVDIDALQVEINPLVETTDKQVVAVDAKIAFDDNAQFRQRDLFALEDNSEKDPREVDASRFNLNYIGMDGNIGCLGRIYLIANIFEVNKLTVDHLRAMQCACIVKKYHYRHDAFNSIILTTPSIYFHRNYMNIKSIITLLNRAVLSYKTLCVEVQNILCYYRVASNELLSQLIIIFNESLI